MVALLAGEIIDRRSHGEKKSICLAGELARRVLFEQSAASKLAR